MPRKGPIGRMSDIEPICFSALRGRRRALTALGSRRMTCFSICLGVLSRTRRGGAGCAGRRADAPASHCPIRIIRGWLDALSHRAVLSRPASELENPRRQVLRQRSETRCPLRGSPHFFRLILRLAMRRQTTASRHLGPGKGTSRGAQGSIIRGCRSPHASCRWIP